MELATAEIYGKMIPIGLSGTNCSFPQLLYRKGARRMTQIDKNLHTCATKPETSFTFDGSISVLLVRAIF